MWVLVFCWACEAKFNVSFAELGELAIAKLIKYGLVMVWGCMIIMMKKMWHFDNCKLLKLKINADEKE